MVIVVCGHNMPALKVSLSALDLKYLCSILVVKKILGLNFLKWLRSDCTCAATVSYDMY